MKTLTACKDNDTTAMMGEVRRWFCADMIISLELLYTITLKFFRLVCSSLPGFMITDCACACPCVYVVVSLDMIQTWNLLQFLCDYTRYERTTMQLIRLWSPMMYVISIWYANTDVPEKAAA